MPIIPGPGAFDGATVGDLVDEIYREWLEPPSDQPVVAILDTGLTDTSPALTYLDNYLSREESFMLAPGTLIEIDSELVRVGGADETTNLLTNLKRGVEGTVATTHAAGVPIKVAPMFPRLTVFNAVASAVANLWPPLYQIKSRPPVVANQDDWIELPPDFIQPIAAYSNDGRRYHRTNIEVLNPFPLSQTGKAAYFPSLLPSPGEVMVSYRAAPRLPQAEDETLFELGIKRAWTRIIKVDVVMDVASNADITRLTPEFVTTQAELELNPVLAASEIRNRLIQYREYLMEQAVADLEHEYGALLTSRDGMYT